MEFLVFRQSTRTLEHIYVLLLTFLRWRNLLKLWWLFYVRRDLYGIALRGYAAIGANTSK